MEILSFGANIKKPIIIDLETKGRKDKEKKLKSNQASPASSTTRLAGLKPAPGSESAKSQPPGHPSQGESRAN